jgi:C4-dicarboxylate-specific signal transduction histidine kinase
MSRAQAQREKILEIERRRYSFKEKMVAINSLAGGIAHEVGNPITCITGLIQEIADDDENQLSKDSKNNFLQLQNYAESLAKLTRDLSIMDTPNPDQNEWININQLISNTVKLYRYDKRWSGISITFKQDHEIPALFFSFTQFNQLITHILENALDAVVDTTHPVILIETKCSEKNAISLIIKDNGCGINEADLPHIFEPFYTTKKVDQGSGMGLAICWAIVHSYHGNLHAESLAGGGLKIAIHLPL